MLLSPNIKVNQKISLLLYQALRPMSPATWIRSSLGSVLKRTARGTQARRKPTKWVWQEWAACQPNSQQAEFACDFVK
jgi:hypothetical protein